MPAGLLVINDSGTVMIDENYRNFAISSSGTVTLDNTGSGSVNFSGAVSPFIATNQAASCIVVGGVVTSGAGVFSFMRGTPNAQIRWWILDVVETASSGNYGLRVYNAAGAICFDSSKYQCRSVGVRDSASAWSGNVTYTAGRSYAVAILSPSPQCKWEWWYNPQEQQWQDSIYYHYASATVSSNVVTFGWIVEGVPGTTWNDGSVVYPNTGPALFAFALVIDVTGQ